MKRSFFIFLISFVTNFIWENLHSVLYSNYKGEQITQLILIRASFWDAIMITIFLLPFLYMDFFKKRLWLIFVIGIVLATIIELYALATGRWSYGHEMPLIPLLNTGLTPTIQLGLLGYLTYKLSTKV
jgi:hypothetical protein